MYKIMILYNNKNHLWKQYGSTTTTTTASGSTTEAFTEFETDDLEVLKEELIKLDAIYGHENIRPYKDLTTTYTVEVEDPEVVADREDSRE